MRLVSPSEEAQGLATNENKMGAALASSVNEDATAGADYHDGRYD